MTAADSSAHERRDHPVAALLCSATLAGDHHGSVGMRRQSLGHAAAQEPLGGSQAARADHDRIVMTGLGHPLDRFRRLAGWFDQLGRDTVARQDIARFRQLRSWVDVSSQGSIGARPG